MKTPDGLRQTDGARVSDGFFRTLGVKPILGRDFYYGEDRPDAPRTTLLTYASLAKTLRRQSQRARADSGARR